MSSFDSTLAVMNNNNNNNNNNDHDHRTNKEKFYGIYEDIVELISAEQVSATSATNGRSILDAIIESRARVLRLLKDPERRGYFSSNIESSDAFLRSHTGSKVDLVILYADLAGSTHLSTVLDPRDLTTILRILMQEMTIIAVKNHGYILKYVGDATIVYFPIIGNNFSLASNNAISCALNILIVSEL